MCTLGDVVTLLFLLACSVADWRSQSLPIWLLGLYSMSVPMIILFYPRETWESMLLGALIGILFFGISKMTKEAIGYGDSWLILILGIYMGWKKLLYLLFLASFGAGIVSLIQLSRKRWNREDSLPFVPFLAAAYIGVMWL